MSAVADSTGAQVAGRSQTGQSQQTGSRSGLKRDVGRLSLLFTSVGSVIGSGWLLGALNATTVAGPAAIISWVVGAIAIMLLALVHAELGGDAPRQRRHRALPALRLREPGRLRDGLGLLARLGDTGPGRDRGGPPVRDKVNDAVGFHLVHSSARTVVLTGPGYAVAAVLMLLFTLINLLGVRRLSDATRRSSGGRSRSRS